MSEPLTGGCLCGEVRYVVDSAVERLAACYCTDCQRMTSAGGSVNALGRIDIQRIQSMEAAMWMKAR